MGRPFITQQDDHEKLKVKYQALKRRHSTLQRSHRIEIEGNRHLEDNNRALEQLNSALEQDKKKLELDLADAEADVRHAQRIAVRSFRTGRHLQHVLGLVEQQLDVGYIRNAISAAYYKGINDILQTGLRVQTPNEGDLYMGPPEEEIVIPATPPLIVEITDSDEQPPPPGVEQANDVIAQANEVITELSQSIEEQEQRQQQRAEQWSGAPINVDFVELSSGEELDGDELDESYVMSPATSEAEEQPGPSSN
jgi:hypothetical protein